VILAAVGLGGATAPFLAGWLLDTFDWRAIFAAEAAIGLVAALASLAVLTPESGAQRHTRPFDLIGAVLIFSGVAGMLVAGNRLPSWGVSSPLVIGLGGGGLILAALFVWRQLRAPNPILDLSIFRIRAFSVPTGTLILHMMSFSTAVILVPFYLEGALGLAPRQASMVFAASPFCLFLGSLVGGALYERVGPYRIAVASLGAALVGFGGLTALTASTGLLPVVLVLALLGLAQGVFQSTTAAAQVAAVPRERLATASALFMTGIMLPISAGLTLGGTLLSARLPIHEASFGVGAAAVAAAYHEVALVGLGFAAAAFLAYAFLGRGRTITRPQGG
ncbi:MAG: MFS transporter, partial [Chloroflexi bacterium]|nr:MFS transporter [Chloroflexota bacterium]